MTAYPSRAERMRPASRKGLRLRIYHPVIIAAVCVFGVVFAPNGYSKTRHTTASKRCGAVPRNFSTVVIDAGHGGIDRGGISGQRIPEKPYTLDVAIRLRTLLKEAGFTTLMTRTKDVFVPLSERVRITNAQSNAVFVSIHFNSATLPRGRGFETYYYAANARPLAARIQSRLMRVLPGTENRGVKCCGYFVLRKSAIPAVLAECGFLTNPDEARLILRATFRQRIAEAIAQAIIAQRNS